MEFPSEKNETDFLLVILDVLNCLAWRTFLAIRLDKSVLVEAILNLGVVFLKTMCNCKSRNFYNVTMAGTLCQDKSESKGHIMVE